MAKVLSDKKYLEALAGKWSNKIMENWTVFEHAFYRHLSENLREIPLQGKSLLLAVSGGLDSMVLCQLMEKFAPVLKFKLALVHIHHGSSEDLENLKYRDEAARFVENYAKKKNLLFFQVKSEKNLRSEAEMRDFRKSQIEKIRRENQFDYSLWAHHEDDFLETQMLRLIRGTGERGVEPMFFAREFELRPLLKFSRKQLQVYAEEQGIAFLEDPSNKDSQYLRNWLRNDWLPRLEDKCPGALRAISRSLLLLSHEKDHLPQDIFLDQKLSRAVYMTLTLAQRKQALAQYIRKQGQMQFTHNQIEEIMKRLDNSEIEHTFKLAQMLWSISRDWIFASPLLLPKPS